MSDRFKLYFFLFAGTDLGNVLCCTSQFKVASGQQRVINVKKICFPFVYVSLHTNEQRQLHSHTFDVNKLI